MCHTHTCTVYVYLLGVLENALNCGTHAHLCTLHVQYMYPVILVAVL